jgi:hypothetical protein
MAVELVTRDVPILIVTDNLKRGGGGDSIIAAL